MMASSTNTEQKYVRIPYLSYVRAIACFFIVVLHTVSASEIIFRDSLTALQGTVSRIVIYGCMWAVPCFLMVTGALQLNPAQEVSLRDIYRVFIWRMIKVLLLCCILFQIFDVVMNGEPFTVGTIGAMLRKFIEGKSWSHLWYPYMLIGLYMLLPFFRMITANADAKQLRYFLLLCVLFISVLPLMELFGVTVGFILPLTTIYPVYLIAGYAVHKGFLPQQKSLAAACVALGAILTIALTFYRDRAAGDVPDVLIGSYAAVPVVLMAFGVFALLKDTHAASALEKVLFEMDRCSFGIYLFHMMFVRLIIRYWRFNPYQFGPIAFLLLAIAIFLVSHVLVWIVKKIPVIGKII